MIGQTIHLRKNAQTAVDSMQLQIRQNYEVSRESDTVRIESNNIKDTIIEHNLTVSHESKELETIHSSFSEQGERAESISGSLSVTKNEVERMVEFIGFFSV